MNRTYKVNVAPRHWVEAVVGFTSEGAYVSRAGSYEVETWLCNGICNAVEDNLDIAIGKQFKGTDPCGNEFKIKRVS